MREIIADESVKDMRADIFVSGLFPQFSRSALKGIFKNNQVIVNDSPVKASYVVKTADVVRIDDGSLFTEPPAISLEILYEDEDAIVMNKPPGFLTHSKGAINTEATVASFLKSRITDKSLRGNRAGIVHRLDRATSGVIIGAKTVKALHQLQKQFEARKAVKIYKAIVAGTLGPQVAVIDAPIGRNPAKPQTFKVQANGKSAQTEYKVESVFNHNSETYSLLELRPKTGRTHQLRVHMAYIGRPIVGDPVYGKDGSPLMLHAYSLSLNLPNGQKRTFTAPLPPSFRSFIGK